MLAMKNPEEKKHGFLRSLGKALGILLAGILLAALVLTILPMTETVEPKTVEGSADWMKDLDGSLRLNEIILPGSHDSGTQHVQLGFVTKCQGLSVAEQLEAGVRYLDIRLAIADAEDPGARQMRLVHGFTKGRTGPMPWAVSMYLDRVLDDCAAFLKAHPTETVILAVKKENRQDDTAEFETRLTGALKDRGDLCLLTDRIPTLEEARGRLVLARRYADAAGLGAEAGIPMGWPEQDDHGDGTAHTALNERNGYRLWVQDRFVYSTEEKWTAFLAGLNEPEIRSDDVSIHFLSTKGTWTYGHPYGHARALNQRLRQLPAERLRGWIILDFADADLCRHVWSANFDE